MSSYQNAGWLSRLISLAKPGQPTSEYVSNVNLVNDNAFRSSRESAPIARVISVSPAPGAGEFAGWEFRADDSLRSPLVQLHGLRAFATGPAAIIAQIQTPSAALIADRTAATFSSEDQDPDVNLSVFTLSTAGGDLPATPMVLPPDLGVTAGWAAIVPWPRLPFALEWQDGQSLYYTGVRVDGSAIIKKKLNGKYYTMAEIKGIYPGGYDRASNPNLLPKNKWIGLRSEVTNESGKVRIKLFLDKGWTGEWQLVAEALDDGIKYGAPITNEGFGGIRTDFMDVEFENFRLRDL